MNILPQDFDVGPIYAGVSSFIANLAPLMVLLITIILGFFVIEKIIDIVKKGKGEHNTIHKP